MFISRPARRRSRRKKRKNAARKIRRYCLTFNDVFRVAWRDVLTNGDDGRAAVHRQNGNADGKDATTAKEWNEEHRRRKWKTERKDERKTQNRAPRVGDENTATGKTPKPAAPVATTSNLRGTGQPGGRRAATPDGKRHRPTAPRRRNGTVWDTEKTPPPPR